MIRERSGCTCQPTRWQRDRVARSAATSATPPGVGASVPRHAELDSDLHTIADSAPPPSRALGHRGANATVNAVMSSPAQAKPPPRALRWLDTLIGSYLVPGMRPIIRIGPPSDIRGAETSSALSLVESRVGCPVPAIHHSRRNGVPDRATRRGRMPPNISAPDEAPVGTRMVSPDTEKAPGRTCIRSTGGRVNQPIRAGLQPAATLRQQRPH